MEQKILIGANCYLNNSIFLWFVGSRFCEMLRNIWRGLFFSLSWNFCTIKGRKGRKKNVGWNGSNNLSERNNCTKRMEKAEVFLIIPGI